VVDKTRKVLYKRSAFTIYLKVLGLKMCLTKWQRKAFWDWAHSVANLSGCSAAAGLSPAGCQSSHHHLLLFPVSSTSWRSDGCWVTYPVKH